VLLSFTEYRIVPSRAETRKKVNNKENWETPKRKNSCYQLPVPEENIHFLDTLEGLKEWKSSILQPCHIVGIDMEWRPSFGTLVRPRVSVLQIAVKGHVFLFDLPKLVKQTETEREETELVTFIQTLFSNPSITKLGYGMAGDLQSLASTYHLFANLNKEMQGIVDLLVVHKTIRFINTKATGHGYCDEAVRQPEKGLSQLVQHVLGKPLDKTEQLSNWEKRPLRQAQIIYAGLTPIPCIAEHTNGVAHGSILVILSEWLCFKPHLLQRPSNYFMLLINSALLSGWSSLEVLLLFFSIMVRSLNASVHIQRNFQIAREEGRVILTCGMPYHTLRSQVGEGRCFSVNCSEKAKDQAIQVLKHFNVQVTPEDIFSRCQVGAC
uniref:3'-5' exonuclease domain-containing protein n=1 Tax=Latimeria chalumnae TaxID=7897 RepID=H3AM31_LATCH